MLCHRVPDDDDGVDIACPKNPILSIKAPTSQIQDAVFFISPYFHSVLPLPSECFSTPAAAFFQTDASSCNELCFFNPVGGPCYIFHKRQQNCQ